MLEQRDDLRWCSGEWEEFAECRNVMQGWEEFLGVCICFFYRKCDCWACCQHGYVLILAGFWGSLLRSARKGCWAMRCLWMGVHLPALACTSSPERVWWAAPLWESPYGCTFLELEWLPLYYPQNIMKQLGLLFWKLSKEDLVAQFSSKSAGKTGAKILALTS